MLAFNNLNKVDKKWSKYLLDTLDLSLRKQFNNNCIDTHKINTNRLINNDTNNSQNSNTYFIIVYGFSCFIAGYFFANKTC
jgi:hypothetical protein